MDKRITKILHIFLVKLKYCVYFYLHCLRVLHLHKLRTCAVIPDFWGKQIDYARAQSPSFLDQEDRGLWVRD